jgi:vacuolar-type H+-ATPase subunit H
MEPQPDVLTLKRIYEAERQADRIVREAEGEAAAILRKADEEAAGLLDERRCRLSALRGEILEAAVSAIDGEAEKLLEGARSRTELWTLKKAAGVGLIVERLLEMVLPS